MRSLRRTPARYLSRKAIAAGTTITRRLTSPATIRQASVGIQHVYADAAAREGLRSGTFAKGATFVVDRFAYSEDPNYGLSQGARKVIAVMVKDDDRYPETGGWGFQAFKGGDPNVRAVTDSGIQCFSCHIPLADNNHLFTRGE